MSSLSEHMILQLESVYGNLVRDISLSIRSRELTLIVSDWGKGTEELSMLLTCEIKPKKGRIIRIIDKKQIRLIPREFISSELKIKDILKLYEKKFGKGDEIWIKTILGDQVTENTKINDLSEINKFKLEILSIFFGKVSLIVAEDFISTMDTQLREYALKMLVKVTKIKSASLVLFNPSVIYPYVFDKIVILFGNEIVEESTKKEFYHPYSLLLQNTKLTLGKLREKIPIKEIGDPSDHGCPYHPYCDLINKELRKRCYTENPKLFNVRDNKVRCWYYENIK